MTGWLSLQSALLIFLLSYSCRQENASSINFAQAQPVVLQDSTQLISFDQEIVPLLKAHCSPCHFPGGKMYARMPFDNSKTITDHPEGVLKRFKDPDLVRIKAYLDQEKQ